jgi:hypothetical protein
VDLEPAEAEVVSLEATAFARALPDPAAQARYEALAVAARAGAIPEELMGPLQTMVELVFERGRPTNRAVLQGVYARTPRGRAQAVTVRDVNRALENLLGQSLAQLRVAVGPAAQTLSIETEQVRVQLEFDRQGVRITQLEGG